MTQGWGTLRRLRNLGRYREILRILIKYGFAQALDQLRLFSLREKIFFRRRRVEEAMPRRAEERLRMALAELGPAFVKLGQLLSTRTDLLPPSYIEELSKLQDRVPPFSPEQAREILSAELGAAPGERFARFDAAPLAAASIGQVHRALLHSGEEVVVKIKRPGVDEMVRRDLDILSDLASFVDHSTSLGSLYRFNAIAGELRQILLRELDYTAEARQAQRFRHNFAGHPQVYMPRVFWENTTRSVLTLEYCEGINLNRYLQDPPPEPPPGEVAGILADSFFKQVFVDGFFHGDPHPGNISILPGGRLCFMDFGAAGYLSETVRGKFVVIARALMGMDTATAVDELLDFAFVPPGVHRLELIRDVEGLQEEYFEVSLKHIDAREAIGRFMQIALKHRLRFPHEFLLLARAMMTLEGTVSRLDPGFNLAAAAKKYAPALQQRLFKLGMLRLRGTLRGYSRLLELFPGQALELMRTAAAGEFKLKVELPQVDGVMKSVKHMGNRLGFSIILASLIIALSRNLRFGYMAWLERVPLGEIVLIGSFLAGLWWLAAVIRSGRL